MDDNPILRVEALNLFYGQSQILFDVDFSARIGEITCLIGTNGVGKTSLLKALSGAQPFSGKYMFDGKIISSPKSFQLARSGLAIVPQGRDIFPLLSVTENIETAFASLSRENRRIDPEIYELFPVLYDMRNRRGGDLSGGQQQQLAIARALTMRPKVMLLDEPTEGIQPNIIKQIGKVIKYLKEQGSIAIVLVEQYFDFAYELADQFYAMQRGKMILSGSKSDLSKSDLLKTMSIA